MITLDSDPAEEMKAKCMTIMRFPVVGGKRIKKARELTLDIGHDDGGGKGGRHTSVNIQESTYRKHWSHLINDGEDC